MAFLNSPGNELFKIALRLKIKGMKMDSKKRQQIRIIMRQSLGSNPATSLKILPLYPDAKKLTVTLREHTLSYNAEKGRGQKYQNICAITQWILPKCTFELVYPRGSRLASRKKVVILRPRLNQLFDRTLKVFAKKAVNIYFSKKKTHQPSM